MQEDIRYGPEDIAAALDEMARRLQATPWEKPPAGFLGIANGGIPFAHRLQQAYAKASGRELPVGVLDVVFSRDDVSTTPIPKTSQPTQIPFDIQDATIILADDVLYSGRTTRAALEELFSHGRPGRVFFAVLFDRGGRLLPFQPDLTGFSENVPVSQKVKVHLSSDKSAEDAIRVFTPATV